MEGGRRCLGRRLSLLQINVILNSALLLIAGFLVGKLVNKIKLPAVTGYLIAGIILGPSILNLMTPEMSEAAYLA